MLFSISSVWDALCPKNTYVPSNYVIWLFGGIPKHYFLSWLAIGDRLSTCDHIRSWCSSNPGCCVLCFDRIETRDHIFFDCIISNLVWSGMIASRGSSHSICAPTVYRTGVDVSY